MSGVITGQLPNEPKTFTQEIGKLPNQAKIHSVKYLTEPVWCNYW